MIFCKFANVLQPSFPASLTANPQLGRQTCICQLQFKATNTAYLVGFGGP